MYNQEDLESKAVEILKTAFKNSLAAQIGEVAKKPSLETQIWILALDEIAEELRTHLVWDEHLGKDNEIYFQVGQRVRWHDKPGIVTGFEIKAYDYPVGYNILCNDGTKVTNSAKGEIELEKQK